MVDVEERKTTVDDIQSHLLEIFKQSCKGCLVFCLLLIKELIAVPSAPMLNPLAEASAPSHYATNLTC